MGDISTLSDEELDARISNLDEILVKSQHERDPLKQLSREEHFATWDKMYAMVLERRERTHEQKV